MLHYYVFKHTDHAFHKLENHWEGQRGQKLLGNGLVLSFLLALITIELNRLGFLPQTISQRLSTNHLVAIEFAFTLLLVFEVISLIFSLSKSVANKFNASASMIVGNDDSRTTLNICCAHLSCPSPGPTTIQFTEAISDFNLVVNFFRSSSNP